MNDQKRAHTITAWALTAALALAVCLAPCSKAKETKESKPTKEIANQAAGLSQTSAASTPAAANQHENTSSSLEVPPGTILPVRLSGSFSTAKSKPGEPISGRIMQDVPLPGGQKIPRGSKILGKVVSVATGSSAASPQLSFRFDTLEVRGEKTPLTTNLRAIAGFMDVEDAQIPVHASGEGEVYDWLPTVQIGGDNVFGKEGPVTAWNNPSDVVGKSTENGVLARVSARESSGCRGELDSNAAPQALWVFSSDACGVYGLPKLSIAHAGRNDPIGLIVLKSANNKLDLPSGTGMLLRVDQSTKTAADSF
jgi:hypothetical protein